MARLFTRFICCPTLSVNPQAPRYGAQAFVAAPRFRQVLRKSSSTLHTFQRVGLVTTQQLLAVIACTQENGYIAGLIARLVMVDAPCPLDYGNTRQTRPVANAIIAAVTDGSPFFNTPRVMVPNIVTEDAS